MTQAARNFRPRFLTSEVELNDPLLWRPYRSSLLRFAAIAAISALTLASPSFAQRGGGGGGGGSHGGGGGGGGSHSGGGFGGGSHASGGSSHGSGGSSHGSKGSSNRSGGGKSHGSSGGLFGHREGSSARSSAEAGKPRDTGVIAAFRHFFGISHPAPERSEALRVSTAPNSPNSLLTRASVSASLPLALVRVHLTPSVPRTFTSKPLELSPRAAFLPRRPAVNAPPRPIPRHPRYYPIYGGYGYYPGFGYYPGYDFGFGFGYGFGFGCPFFFFDCYDALFNYFDTGSSSWHYNPHAEAVMWIYLNDGSALEVTDYWLEDDAFYYVLESGHRGNVPLADVDINRTSDANSRLGFLFNLNRTQRGTPLDRADIPNPDNPPPPPPAQQDQSGVSSPPSSPPPQPRPSAAQPRFPLQIQSVTPPPPQG